MIPCNTEEGGNQASATIVWREFQKYRHRRAERHGIWKDMRGPGYGIGDKQVRKGVTGWKMIAAGNCCA